MGYMALTIGLNDAASDAFHSLCQVIQDRMHEIEEEPAYNDFNTPGHINVCIIFAEVIAPLPDVWGRYEQFYHTGRIMVQNLNDHIKELNEYEPENQRDLFVEELIEIRDVIFNFCEKVNEDGIYEDKSMPTPPLKLTE